MSDLYMRLDDAVKRINLLCKWEFGKDYTFNETVLKQELEQICQVPSPVEVVRCKECKHCRDCILATDADGNVTDTYKACSHWRRETFDNEYCSYGIKE